MSRARLERVLAEALRSPDPVAHLKQAAIAEDAGLTGDERRWLGMVDADGVRLCTLQVARLRWERLLRGSLAVQRWFAQDEVACVAAFRQYHRAVPMTAHFPEAEAALFLRWVQAQEPEP